MSSDLELRTFLSKCVDTQDQEAVLEKMRDRKVTLKLLLSLASKSIERVDSILNTLNIEIGYAEAIKIALEEELTIHPPSFQQEKVPMPVISLDATAEVKSKVRVVVMNHLSSIR